MKKKLMALLLAVVSASVLLCSLAGCSGSSGASGSDPEKDSPINLTVIMGITRNSPDPELSLLNGHLDRLAAYGGHLCVIVDEGDPKSSFRELDLSAPDPNKSANYRKKEIQANAKKAAQLIQSMKAGTPETNTLAALKLAADNTPSANGRKNVAVILDNGIQTKTGNLSAFPMTDLRVLDVKINDVMQSLENSKSIPDMSKFEVIEWYGLGQTVSVGEEGQEPLLNCDVEALKAYYTEILKKGGVADAGKVFIDRTYKPSASDHSAYPHVSAVAVTRVEQVPLPEPDEEPSSETGKIIDKNEVFRLDETKEIRFKPDSVELIDPEAAREVLAGLISRMKNLDGNIVIIGTTAHVGDEAQSKEFSRKRAMTIKNLMAAEGIEPERILVFGAGYSDKRLVVDDLDENGRLDEKVAHLNRAVNIIDPENEIAKSYINGADTRKE